MLVILCGKCEETLETRSFETKKLAKWAAKHNRDCHKGLARLEYTDRDTGEWLGISRTVNGKLGPEVRKC